MPTKTRNTLTMSRTTILLSVRENRKLLSAPGTPIRASTPPRAAAGAKVSMMPPTKVVFL